MSVRKSRRTKAPPDPVNRIPMESFSLSAGDQDSFFKGLKQDNSEPLHSTALEEQLDQQPGQREELPAAGGRTGSRGGEERRKRTGVKAGGKGQSRRQQGAVEQRAAEKEERSETSRPAPTADRGAAQKQLVRTRKSSGRSAPRQQLERVRESAEETTTEAEDSSSALRRRSRRLPSSCSEEEEEGDECSVWNPSPKKAKRLRLGRKSSSGRNTLKTSGFPSAGAEGGGKQKPGRVGGSQLEVVLDAFLGFCQQYRASVESAAARESIARFSDGVRNLFLEKISSLKDLRSLKSENTKVGSLIRKKTQKLLNAKHELMRAERQVCLLQKEKAELQQRLSDLRRGQAFLRGVRELTAGYLAHRRQHPADKETFGAASLPALLLETQLLQRAGRRPTTAVSQSKKKAQKQ